MLEFISVLTLNVWGIPFISRDREARIAAICAELTTGRYDIVSLQEVWSQADFKYLQEKTQAVLPYSHYFHSGVFGAGLLVLSKFPIISTLFHAWSVNGYFHRIQHADWFGGKGVGLCKLLVGDQIIHFYNAHLHAEYNNENDDYKTHRVIQAFDTAQFIEATRGDAAIQILAGDLNTQPQDISYKVLLYNSKMKDCCLSNTIATNECQRNSYSAKRALAKNPLGIRIDHIFIRPADNIEASIVEYTLPFPERVPGQKFSYSDHEAVLVRLKLGEIKRKAREIATCPLPNEGDATLRSMNNEKPMTNGDISEQSCPVGSDSKAEAKTVNRISILRDSVALCDASLQQLRCDRIFYYSIALFLTIFLITLAEYSVPRGFKTLYLLLKFVVFGVILFCIFMGTIWNLMERNGILSGKTSMEISLRTAEKYEEKDINV